MKKIFKYKVEVTDDQVIKMPVGRDILSVQSQNGSVCLWALVDPDEEVLPFKFKVVGTGELIHFDMNEWAYIATVQHNDFVWHVFIEA